MLLWYSYLGSTWFRNFECSHRNLFQCLCIWQLYTCSKEFPSQETVREERNKAWTGWRMAAGDSRAEQAVLTEKRVKRKVIETQCAMRAVLLPEVLWDEGETPKFSEVSCSQLCLQCCGFESWKMDALSCVHVTQSICRPTSAPSGQCDLHLTFAQCEQTDQPRGDTAKTVSYSILQPRRHLYCRESKLSARSSIFHQRIGGCLISSPSISLWKSWSNWFAFKIIIKLGEISQKYCFIPRRIPGKADFDSCDAARGGESMSFSRQQVVGMLEWTSGGNTSLGKRFVGLAASVCQEPEALPKLTSVMSLPI